MDTSKEYIEMCEKAIEVQDEWEYKEEEAPDTFYVRTYGGYCALCESVRGRASWAQTGDDLISVLNRCHECGNKLIVRESNSNVNFPEYGSIEDWSNGGKESIWLPRQDQLQQMLITKTSPTPRASIGILMSLHGWYARNAGYTTQLITFEQIWLAFVMKMKHDKGWKEGVWQALKGGEN